MSPRRLGFVLRFELGQLAARPALWVWVAFTLFLACALAIRSSGSHQDSVVATCRDTAVLTLLDAFFVAIAAGLAVIQDDEHRFGELIHATPLRPSEYVLGKLLAIMAFFGTVLMLRQSLILLVTHGRSHSPAPFTWTDQALPLLGFSIPMLAFMAGLCFALGERTRHSVTIFFPPVAALVLCLFLFWPSRSSIDPGWNRLLMVLDPTGWRWLGETRSQTDGTSLPRDALFTLSRLAFLATGVAAVASASRHLTRALRGGGAGRRSAAPRPKTGTALPAAGALRVRPVTLLQGTRTVAVGEWRQLVRHPGSYLFGPFLVLFMFGVVYNDLHPRRVLTSGVVASILFEPLLLYLCSLLVFNLTDSLERETRHGMESIVRTTPVPTAALLVGKALANLGAVTALVVICLGVCVLLQVVQGLASVQLWPYLHLWGLLMMPSVLFWMAVIMAVHAVARHRWTTYAVGLGGIAVTLLMSFWGSLTWATNWLLWGTLRWTDFGAFDADRASLILNRMLVLGSIPWLGCLALRGHSRRTSDAMSGRTAHSWSPLARKNLPLLSLAAVPLMLLTLLGLRVAFGYEGKAARQREKVYRLESINMDRDAPLPSLAAVDLDVTLHTRSRRFETRGAYTLENRQDLAVDSIPITVRCHMKPTSWTVDGRPIQPEDRNGLWVIHQSLAPGRSARVGFALEGALPNGSSRNGARLRAFILDRAIHLPGGFFSPVLGFDPTIGIDGGHRFEPRDSTRAESNTRFTCRMRITGPRHLQYSAVGAQVEDRIQGATRTTVWQSVVPVPSFHIAAGSWTRRDGNGVSVFHHPRHAINTQEMLEALEASRSCFSEWFGPCPWGDLRLYETPGVGDARAVVSGIALGESMALTLPGRPVPGFGRTGLFAVVAHETAHQWWGTLVRPGESAGGGLMGEGLANYSTALLLTAARGDSKRMAFMQDLEDLYARRRLPGRETALWDLSPQHARFREIIRTRGAWVMWMLQDTMGREALQAALRSYISQYQNHETRPLIQDFLAILRDHAPDKGRFDAFVWWWIRGVEIPEYKIEQARKSRQADGTWSVRFTIWSAGGATMPVTVAAIRGARSNEPHAYQEQRLTCVLAPGAKETLALGCPFEPDRLVVDPDVQVMQLNRGKGRLPL